MASKKLPPGIVPMPSGVPEFRCREVWAPSEEEQRAADAERLAPDDEDEKPAKPKPRIHIHL